MDTTKIDLVEIWLQNVPNSYSVISPSFPLAGTQLGNAEVISSNGTHFNISLPEFMRSYALPYSGTVGGDGEANYVQIRPAGEILLFLTSPYFA